MSSDNDSGFWIIIVGLIGAFIIIHWWYIVVPIIIAIIVIVAIVWFAVRKHKKNEETKFVEEGKRKAFETIVEFEEETKRIEEEKRNATAEKRKAARKAATEKRKAEEEIIFWEDEEPNDTDIIWFQPPTRRKTGTTKKATKNTKKESKESQSPKKSNDNLIYLLDGSNLLRQEEETHGISLDVICSITDYLKDHGSNYYVLFDANARHVVNENNKADLKRFDLLLKKEPSHFRLVPGGKPADGYLLEEARRNPNAVILTNDRYRDHFDEYPDVLNDSERCLQPMQFMMDGSIWFSGIDLSIPMKRGSWNRTTKSRKS